MIASRTDCSTDPSADPPPAREAAARAADPPPGADTLFAELYTELRRRARGARRRSAAETLSTTGLVHETYLKLRGRDVWASREHFLNTAARAMRQVLVNAAEARVAAKRGGGAWTVTLDEGLGVAPARAEDILELDQALERFAAISPRQARVVECRYFAGLSVEETAAALAIGTATVQRDWRFARAWLQQALTEGAAHGAGSGGPVGR